MRFLLCFLAAALSLVGSAAGAMVTVNMCNGFPGTSLVSFQWGTFTSGRGPYGACQAVQIDNAITQGMFSVWSSQSATTSSANVSVAYSTGQTWCTNGNRNWAVVYSDATGKATVQSSLGSSCAALGKGVVELLVVDGACNLAGNLDFVLNVDGTTEKLNTNPVACGNGFTFDIPPSTGPAAKKVVLNVYTSGTTTSLAGPFDMTNAPSPNSDGTLLLLLAGDAKTTPSMIYSVSQPAGQQSSAVSAVGFASFGTIVLLALAASLANLF